MVKAAGLRAVPNIWWERRMESPGWRAVKSQVGTASVLPARGPPEFPARQRSATLCKYKQ